MRLTVSEEGYQIIADVSVSENLVSAVGMVLLTLNLFSRNWEIHASLVKSPRRNDVGLSVPSATSSITVAPIFRFSIQNSVDPVSTVYYQEENYSHT